MLHTNNTSKYPVVMTIAGSDSGGGAGIQADLKTFHSLNTFGTSTITAVTAQNTMGVQAIFPIDLPTIEEQISSVANDFDIIAIKTGMLHDSAVIRSVAKQIQQHHLTSKYVIDPVMIAKGGTPLLLEEAQSTLFKELLPLGTVITPNIPEAEVLTHQTIKNDSDRISAAETILSQGCKAVIIKGGHRYKGSPLAEDFYLDYTGKAMTLSAPRINTPHTHGTGCTFSAALTAFLAHDYPLDQATIHAKAYIHAAIVSSLNLGHGHGPTNHWAYAENSETFIKQVNVNVL